MNHFESATLVGLLVKVCKIAMIALVITRNSDESGMDFTSQQSLTDRHRDSTGFYPTYMLTGEKYICLRGSFQAGK